MPQNRKDISEADRRFLIAQSAGRCNKCRREVFIENEFGEKARLGDDAHIVACSDRGPRGQSSKTESDRASLNNLILLCKNCHSEVDQQPQSYTEDCLIRMREEHYAWIRASLGERIIQRPPFHYLYYINVPRVDMYAVAHSISLPQLSFGQATSFKELGFNAGKFMASYTHVLNDEDLYANVLEDGTSIEHVKEGSYWFSHPANFRSKRIQGQPDLLAAWARLESIIYRKFDGWKLICQIDPRWITTTSAYATLNNGTLTATGIVHIKTIDLQRRIAIASPLFLGAPDV